MIFRIDYNGYIQISYRLLRTLLASTSDILIFLVLSKNHRTTWLLPGWYHIGV